MEDNKRFYIFYVFMITIVLAIIATSIKISKEPQTKKYPENNVNYNAEIQNLRMYIPPHWKLIDEKFTVSPSGNCKVLGGTVLYDQERMERIFIGEELEHEEKVINGINMSYGYKDNGERKTYSYFFEDNGTKYFILFVNNNSDEECNPYLERIENSITLVKE